MTDIVQRLRLIDPNQVLLAPPPHDTSYLQVGLLCHEAANEIERLRADAEQWKDLATDAVSGLAYIREVHGDLYGVGWDRVFTKKAAIDKAMAEERKP
jgi:hypothetical protein